MAKKRPKKPATPHRKLPHYKQHMHPEVLDADQAAEVLGISRTLLLRLAREGKLPGKKLGKEWRFRLSALLRWLGDTEQPVPSSLEALLKDPRVQIRKKR